MMLADSSFWVGPESAPQTYRLVELLGGGGEGEVWRAVLPLSESGERDVAVKIMTADVDADEAAWTTYGHLLQSLAHPGLVHVTDVFLGPAPHRRDETTTDRLSRYVVMDYVEGATLRDWVVENPTVPAGARLARLRMAASALDEMHGGSRTKVPVAHGDIKPANIVVSKQGGSVLVDLGLARLTDAKGQAGRSNPYAAPELRGEISQATIAADAFAFAVTTAQVLTGQLPPVDAGGFVDVTALRTQLLQNPITQQYPVLIERIIQVLTVDAQDRPTLLRPWLDSTLDALSQTQPGAEAAVQQEGATSPSLPIQVPAPANAPSVPADHAGPDKSKGRWRGKLAAAALIIVLLLAGGGGYVLTHGSAKARPKVAAPGSLASAQTSSAPSSASTSGAEATDSAAADASGSMVSASNSGALPSNSQFTTTQYVSDMKPVDSDSNASYNSYQTGKYAANGKTYAHAINLGGACSRDGGDNWLEYDLARSWSTITGTVGLDDGSPSSGSMSWKILLDSTVIASGTQTLGTSTPINVTVKNGLRLRLWVNDPAAQCSSPEAAIDFGNLELGA